MTKLIQNPNLHNDQYRYAIFARGLQVIITRFNCITQLLGYSAGSPAETLGLFEPPEEQNSA